MAENVGAGGVLLGLEEGKSSNGGLLRGLFALVLLVGMAVAGYEIFRQYQYVEPPLDESSPVNANADRDRLNKMIDNIRSSISARENSAGMVRSALMVSRYPFGAPERAPDIVAAANASSIKDPENYAIELDVIPPVIELKGIISLGNSVVAMMNIDGESNGKVYRVGDAFAERKGRVVKISKNSVTVRYEGKNFTYSH